MMTVVLIAFTTTAAAAAVRSRSASSSDLPAIPWLQALYSPAAAAAAAGLSSGQAPPVDRPAAQARLA